MFNPVSLYMSELLQTMEATKPVKAGLDQHEFLW